MVSSAEVLVHEQVEVLPENLLSILAVTVRGAAGLLASDSGSPRFSGSIHGTQSSCCSLRTFLGDAESKESSQGEKPVRPGAVSRTGKEGAPGWLALDGLRVQQGAVVCRQSQGDVSAGSSPVQGASPTPSVVGEAVGAFRYVFLKSALPFRRQPGRALKSSPGTPNPVEFIKDALSTSPLRQ